MSLLPALYTKLTTQRLIQGTKHLYLINSLLELYNTHSNSTVLRYKLSVSNGLVLRGDRIIIPKALQEKAVKIAHSSHQGIVKTKALMRETVWFPGLDKKVERAVRDCLPCQASTRSNTSSNHAPLKMTKMPNQPWEEVSADFHGPLASGEYLLVVVDDFSSRSRDSD